MHPLRASLIPGILLAVLGAAPEFHGARAEDSVRDIGSRLEPFFDGYLIDRLEGVTHRLHEPRPEEKVLALDKPWEGRHSAYTTVLKDGPLLRMYYRGLPSAGKDGSDVETTCLAVSVDGVHWTKPNLGVVEVMGTWENNAVLARSAPYSHNFAPFLDDRPGVPPEERFKALAGTRETGLVPFVSEDGVRWRKLREEGVIAEGAFDSQNVSFWSEAEGCYCCYFRTWTSKETGGFRTVSRATSEDYVNWTEPVAMTYGDRPYEHLYTNQTLPYFRAPHLYVSIAARFMPGRKVVKDESMEALRGSADYSNDCSDAVFFTSRGGSAYDRTFMESFLRPGLGDENWTSRTNYPAHGIVETGEGEISFYVNRNYGQDTAYVQRYTLRTDGFASVSATYSGGEMTTPPLRFEGTELALNVSTSAAGSVRVEVLSDSGEPVEGYSKEDCDEIVGDEIERVVTWKGSPDLSSLSGNPVRLRFVLKDADLYSIRFR